jgi:hypothetical protein
MGWMDKAKKLAEQAQEKLDEAQQNFNKGGSTPGQEGGGGARYDAHGRPIEDGPPAGSAPPPSAEPAPSAPAAEPDPAATSAAATEPTAPEPPPAPASSEGGANATPDPFKPLQQ